MSGDPSTPADESRVKYRAMQRDSGSTSGPGSPPRRGVLPYIVLVVVTFFISWFIFATVSGVPVGLVPAPSHSTSKTPSTGVFLTVDNPFDTGNNSTCAPCTDQYAPANFSVPAHTLLEFTIINYDTGQNAVTPVQSEVNGTVGNCMYLNSTPTALGPCVHSIPDGFVAHTFSFVQGAYAGFNVPLPSALNSPEGGIGASVTFFAYFNTTGTFTWNCVAPCDPYSMATAGFMTGTMTVVSS